MLKVGPQLKDMQSALKKGTESINLLVKEFDEQLQTMIHNQEIALQSISDLRRKVDKRLDKLQKNITDELITLFKKEKRDMEASSRQIKRLMNGMKNTLKSSIKAAKENDHNDTILLYQRGQAEVESCKTLVTEISMSFTTVSIEHHIVPGNDITSDDAMGKIVLRKQPRWFPTGYTHFANLMTEQRVKEIGKFSMKSPSEKKDCCAHGITYLPCAQIVVSDYFNCKLKLFSDKGQYLFELPVLGNPWDICLLNNNTVAVAISSPGGILVVKVEASKLFLTSEINMSNGKDCYGITHKHRSFVVGAGGGEVYSVTHNGVAELLYKYNSTCLSLTHHPIKLDDTLASIHNTTLEDTAVTRLSADKRCTDLIKVGVIRRATGIDVDREGNIYVCGGGSHNIVQISGDGTHVRELLTSSDKINTPWAISVCGDRFVVTDNSRTDAKNYIRVFQLS